MAGTMRILMVLAAVLLAAMPAWAGDPGSATAQFLKTGQGARPMGMGGAYAALADDVNAVYWNPGGLGEVARPELLFMHNNNYIDISNQFLGFVYPLPQYGGTFGLGVTYQDYGSMDRTVITGANTYSSTGSFDATDLAVALGYGQRLAGGYAVGGTLKYIRSKIDDDNASAWAVDLGLMYRVPDQPLTLGLAVQNLGSKMKFISQSDKLPLNLKAGAAYEFMPGLTLALDLNKPIDNNLRLNAGIEYWPADMFALRVGYDGMNKAGNGMTAGAGFRFSDFALDYAWVDGGDLDDAHRVSLNYVFGPLTRQ